MLLAPLGSRVALVLGVVLSTLPLGACPRPGSAGKTATTPVPAAPLGPLAGRWVAERIEREGGVVIRRTQDLLTLRAGADKGTLVGTLRRRGTLSTTTGQRLACNTLPRAAVDITGKVLIRRRGDRHVARVTEWSADSKCAKLFQLRGPCRLLRRRAALGGPGGMRWQCAWESLRLGRLSLDGTWSYESRATDRAGDTRITTERCQLRQKGQQVAGFCDEIVLHISNDGQRYRCNGRLRFSRQARHFAIGTIQGDMVHLRFPRTLVRRSACQAKRGAHPEYHARWRPFADQLEVAAGPGKRVLQRYERSAP